jgi:hypothetical protein
MKHLFAALVLTSALAAVQANAACPYPVAPGKFPDGNQATKDEMLAAKSQVVKYNTEMDTYLECIKTEFDTRLAENTNASADEKAKMQSKQDEKHNAAVKEVLDVTERFNEQLRAWKAKNGTEKKSS